jgi:hypothetical protein
LQRPNFLNAHTQCQGSTRSVRHSSRVEFRLRDRTLNIFSPPPANVLIDQVAASPSIQNGSSSQQRKGYISLGCPLLSQPACLAQDYSRAGRRADSEARKEGRHPLPVRMTAWRVWQQCTDQIVGLVRSSVTLMVSPRPRVSFAT